eukprot:229745_1
MSQDTTTIELIVCYFVRTMYEEQFDQINIPSALKQIIINYTRKIIVSSIITLKEDVYFMQLLSTKLTTCAQFKLLYTASTYNYSAKTFHEMCDERGPTICIIKNNCGNVFGGYASVKWSSIQGTKQDPNAFLFLIRSTNINYPILIECDIPEEAVYHNRYRGPCFGLKHDIHIDDKCNMWSTNCCIAHSYQFSSHTLCGTDIGVFRVTEYEIFEVL